VLAELLGRTTGSARDEFVADEVAARLGTDRRDAARRVAVARGAARIPEVTQALASGDLDRDKAEVLVTTANLPDGARRAEVRRLLPEAGRLTVDRLRERLRTEFDATLPQFDVLAALHRHEKGLKMSALSEALILDGPFDTFASREWEEGLLMPQSRAAMAVARALAPSGGHVRTCHGGPPSDPWNGLTERLTRAAPHGGPPPSSTDPGATSCRAPPAILPKALRD
jgi:hypothetical protein